MRIAVRIEGGGKKKRRREGPEPFIHYTHTPVSPTFPPSLVIYFPALELEISFPLALGGNEGTRDDRTFGRSSKWPHCYRSPSPLPHFQRKRKEGKNDGWHRRKGKEGKRELPLIPEA